MTEKTKAKCQKDAPEKLEKMPASTPQEKGGKPAALAPVLLGWKWTKKKRKAVRLIVQGWTYRRIGTALGLNEKTVRRWRKVPEFHAALLDKAREYMDGKRFKRTHETGILTDQLAALAANRLAQITKAGGEANQAELNQLQLYLREYREFKNSEKIDFGDDPRGGGINVNIGIGIGGAGAGGVGAGSQSFKAFVEEHLDAVPERAITGSTTPQQALLSISEALIEETSLLDDLYEEDKVIAVAEEAAKK